MNEQQLTLSPFQVRQSFKAIHLNRNRFSKYLPANRENTIQENLAKHFVLFVRVS